MFSAAAADPSVSTISYAVVMQVTQGLKLKSAYAERMSEPWERCLLDLQALFGLQDDWDGEGSATPDPANVKSAMRLVTLAYQSGDFSSPPQVVPVGNGEVLLAWRTGGLYLEAELAAPGKVEWMLSEPNRQTNHWTTELPSA